MLSANIIAYAYTQAVKRIGGHANVVFMNLQYHDRKSKKDFELTQLCQQKETIMKKFKTIASVMTAVIALSLLGVSTSAYTCPTESTRITQYFSPSHQAIDIGPLTPGVAGDDVYSFADGNVYRYDYDCSAGYVCRVNNPMGSYYVGAKYNHLTDPDTLSDIIDSGSVDEGDKIGEMNTTGNDSTGVHLHFEIRENDTPYTIYTDWYAGEAVDPLNYFPNMSSASRSAGGVYYDPDPTATEYNLVEAVTVSHAGREFDVRWIANMNDAEMAHYNITDDVIKEALSAIFGNAYYSEYYGKLCDKLA